jgi:hypothetical protein
VADPDPELEHLLKAERLAFERYDGLRGYPGDVQEVALALWTEASEAPHPQHLAHRAGETVHRLLVGRPIMFGFGLLHGSLLQGDLVHAIGLLGHTSRGLMQPAERPHEE